MHLRRVNWTLAPLVFQLNISNVLESKQVFNDWIELKKTKSGAVQLRVEVTATEQVRRKPGQPPPDPARS